MANSFPGSGLAYADSFSVGNASSVNSTLYVCSSCVQAVRIEHNYDQTNLHHNTLWLRANNAGALETASIGFTVVNGGGDHHRANIAATGNANQIGGNLALYTRNNNGSDQLGLYIDNVGNVGIGTTNPTPHNGSGGFIIQGGGGGRAIMELHDSSASGKSVFQNVGGDTYIGQLAKGSGAGDLYMLTGGNGTSANVSMVIKCAGNVGIGTSSPFGNTKVDIRTSCPLTSEVGQPLFLGSNDVTGPLGVVIQHLCGYGVCRVDFTSTRYGISGNDLSLNVDSSDPNTAGGLYIKYRGNVGIGTSSPNRKLTISRATESSSPQIELRNVGGITDGNFDGISFTQGSTGDVPLGSIRLKNSSIGYPGFGIYTRNSSTTESEKFTLTNVGNIGVGTSSPLGSSTERTLHLSDAGGGYATLYVTNAANSVKGIVAIASSAQTVSFGSQSNHALRLITNDTTRMLINTGGCAGIGTTTPCTFLVIKGGAGSAKTDLLSISTSDGAGSQPTMRFDTIESNSNILGRISTCDLGIYSSAMIFEAAGCKLSGSTTTTEIMRLVGSTGNVGMGTTSPSYKLHVNGTFYSAGSSVDYKEGICNYNTDSCLFMCLKPVTYQYKDEYTHLGKELKSETQIGLIAEDVAEVYPELAILVNEDEQKVVRNVDYEKLSIILLSEVQKLRKEVDNLKNNK